MGGKARARQYWAGWFRKVLDGGPGDQEIVLCAVSGDLDPCAISDYTVCNKFITLRGDSARGSLATMQRRGKILCDSCVTALNR